MEFSRFRRQFAEAVSKRPKLFNDYGSDPPATEGEVQQAEQQLGCSLGEKYRVFLKEYGGGEIGSEVVYSAHTDSDWNVADMNTRANLRSRGVIAFSENGCGDFNVFVVENGVAQDRVLFYDHEADTIEDTEYQDLFEYLIAQFGLLP